MASVRCPFFPMKSSDLSALRALYVFGLAEGTSFLVLLLVGMPLKYLAQQPAVVRFVGPIHGGLFLIYVGLVLLNGLLCRWKWTRVGLGIVSSVVPLGPFFFDAGVKREIAALEAGARL